MLESLSERIAGRISLNDVLDPNSNDILISANEMITHSIANNIEASGIESVDVRSLNLSIN